MKKSFILCAVYMLIILPVIAGCQQQPAPTSITKPAIESKTYTSSEHSFSVEYPADWDFFDDLPEEELAKGVAVIFVSLTSPEDEQSTKIIIQANRLTFKPSCEEYAEIFESNVLKKNLPDYAKLDEQNTTINDIPALTRTFTATMNGVLYKVLQTYFPKEDIGYMITYNAPADSYDKYKDCCDLSMSTFKLE